MEPKKIMILLCLVVSCLSCSKDDDEPGANVLGTLKGQIIYEYTSDVKIIDLASGKESDFFGYNAYSTIGWDLSKDGKLRLISEREPGEYVKTRFMLVSPDDGRIKKEFNYTPPSGNAQKSGVLSYDNSLILLNPDFDNGIVIMDTNGEIKYQLDGINDQELTLGDRAYWLPGNSILIVFDEKYILRSDPPYTSLTLVKEMEYEQWGNIRVSMDGKKLSLYVGNHIYLMDIDGNNLVQVTESDARENMAEFSPDGRHLLVGCDYIHAPNAGLSKWDLKIIPADGKKYHLDNSPEIIPVVPVNTGMLVTAGGPVFWRP
ncbi:hypothetical protein EDD80_11565 [Anseongella ginsenosidimutans]|uniref:WD40 repeat protein n=1 Tax=Anseongella ginsenosidimutans TaxID=496056 RepID=A0A4R3KM01_9SPHI|nr:hypothetical protein [Anseongella ginsenosidimutans]QEC51896.1 hypothetical protein FRZ59_05805 [Anseongella ginsenosidimutans]TCS85082.1 hypothetical protein EDD80_11565 [Anseongella ginsenosidimutans]